MPYIPANKAKLNTQKQEEDVVDIPAVKQQPTVSNEMGVWDTIKALPKSLGKLVHDAGSQVASARTPTDAAKLLLDTSTWGPVGAATELAKVAEFNNPINLAYSGIKQPVNVIKDIVKSGDYSLKNMENAVKNNPLTLNRPVSYKFAQYQPDSGVGKVSHMLGSMVPDVLATLATGGLGASASAPKVLQAISKSPFLTEVAGGILGGAARGEPKTAAVNAVTTPLMFGAGKLVGKATSPLLNKMMSKAKVQIPSQAIQLPDRMPTPTVENPTIAEILPEKVEIQKDWAGENFTDPRNYAGKKTDTGYNWMEELGSRGETVLNKSGKLGQDATKLINNASADEMKLRIEWRNAKDAITKSLNDAEYAEVDKALRGENYTSTPKIDAAVGKMRPLLDNIYNMVSQGADKTKVRPYLQNYMPERGTQEFLDSLKNKQSATEYVKWLRKTHPDIDEAAIQEFAKVLDTTGDFGKAYKIIKDAQDKGAVKSGSFYKERTGAIPRESLRRDQGLLNEYLDSAAEQASRNNWLGEDYTQLDSLYGQMPKGSYEQDYLNKVTQSMRNKGKPTDSRVGKVLNFVDKLQVYKLTPISSMKNLLDMTKIFGLEGATIPQSAKTIAKAFTPSGKAKAGQWSLPENIDTPNTGFAKQWSDAIGMTKTEKLARTSSYLSGQDIAKNALSKLLKNPKSTYWRQTLNNLGIDAEAAIARRSLTPDDISAASFSTLKKLQGTGRVIDYPLGISSNQIGASASKFKRQAYTTTTFINDMVKRSMKSPRDLANTVTMLSVMYGGGYVIGEAKDAVKTFLNTAFGTPAEQEPDVQGWLKSVDPLLEGIGAGMYGDIGRISKSPGDALKWAAGPSLSSVAGVVSPAVQGTLLATGLIPQKPNAMKTAAEKSATQFKNAGRSLLTNTPLNMIRYNLIPKEFKKNTTESKRKSRYVPRSESNRTKR